MIAELLDRLGSDLAWRGMARYNIDDVGFFKVDSEFRIDPAMDHRPLRLLTAARFEFLLGRAEVCFHLRHGRAANRAGQRFASGGTIHEQGIGTLLGEGGCTQAKSCEDERGGDSEAVHQELRTRGGGDTMCHIPWAAINSSRCID